MPLAPIESIEQLKKNLNLGPGHGGYIELVKAIQIPLEDWKPFISWNAEEYTRNCIANCESYELLLMCWQKDQASPIHNYSLQEGWVKVIEGELNIETHEVNSHDLTHELKEKVVVREGETTYLNDSMGFQC
jgi:cysteine dioxygenase